MLQIRCISDTGEQLGVISTSDAMRLAEARGMDLVEISPTANPPVCRIMNFGKYRYEESRKEKLARKHQSSTVVKEMKFHVNVEEHDYQTKLNHIIEFLKKNHRVKASLLFRGRENEHRDLGYAMMNRLIKDCEPVGSAEAPPRMFGNNLMIMLRPAKSGGGN
ncbi:MAG: translation initiation factor IF-3 [Verrucomicrobia bacterium]|nr:translation initiation factor IF-3 [Verrucomicrobiota bacterium]MCG2681648.1 translation initiation factor IF-3 [Kiritimatiellia bacterium]MBU4248100.1 translation initiation factor IF-3 [Verrucomicrobiota bacterium]MBU4290776.1 translation initiation factor IF-3 [Verrucomicrobiota bacterium]MBU4429749.1 translation initiation factor IF-3 [Verrucomicrobiota bacterium]